MSTTELAIVIALAVILVAGIAIFFSLRGRRTGKLRGKFGGAEYDRALKEGGNRRQAEAALDERAARVESLDLQPLAAADRARFEDSWRRIQTRFVDGPAGAVMEADQLLGDVMSTRGYPVSDFEQRASDVSVNHPRAMVSYRSAHEIALRQMKGQASTEELRQAMIQFRTLFEELVSEPQARLVHHVYFARGGLPDLEPFVRFEPPTTGVVYDANGRVLVELAREYRRGRDLRRGAPDPAPGDPGRRGQAVLLPLRRGVSRAAAGDPEDGRAFRG
jgi:hypothetical protein